MFYETWNNLFWRWRKGWKSQYIYYTKETCFASSCFLQVIKMLICVVILFFICWGPRFIMEIIIKSHTITQFNHALYWSRVILFLLPFVHAVINPIIYMIMSKNFRTSLRVLGHRRCYCCSLLPGSSSRGEHGIELQLRGRSGSHNLHTTAGSSLRRTNTQVYTAASSSISVNGITRLGFDDEDEWGTTL